MKISNNMQHFIIDEDISEKSIHILDKELLHQMQKVLRFKKGNKCVVLDGQGSKAKGMIEELHRKGAVITLSDHELCEAPKKRLRLYCALSKKPSTFELIVQKATELGVTDIVPLVAERCQIKQLRKPERLKLIIKEASEQSERCYLPKLHEAVDFASFLNSPPKGMILAGDPWKYDKKLKEVERSGDISIVIGPEGGLTDEELEGIHKLGGTVFQLGETVLRIETAVIAALSVVQFG